MPQKKLLHDAVTQDKRKKQLTKVLKTIFTKVYIEGKTDKSQIDSAEEFHKIKDFEITRVS